MSRRGNLRVHLHFFKSAPGSRLCCDLSDFLVKWLMVNMRAEWFTSSSGSIRPMVALVCTIEEEEGETQLTQVVSINYQVRGTICNPHSLRKHTWQFNEVAHMWCWCKAPWVFSQSRWLGQEEEKREQEAVGGQVTAEYGCGRLSEWKRHKMRV